MAPALSLKESRTAATVNQKMASSASKVTMKLACIGAL
jgi:hypothetical protein